ncbi:hypothetical protein HPP05_25985 [Corallococcus exiguus]|uniref:hypothetical protein n=1 Tax=Corallococcus exiguus TaxID=83462 RepID=UPI0014948725|nr:hypothetical protein [Corallococcus exiguus]NPC73204.1 hypothetical protein [Corallococcus exiguus]
MRFWIAIVAGLSMGQAYDPEPLPPEDPSVRDPAAAALQDAYRQANEDRNGARPPQGYVIQAPSDPTEGSYYSLTPLMSDGDPPVTSGDVAVQQSQKYVPPPVPTVFEQEPTSNEPTETEAAQPQTGTGGAGTAGSPTEQPATGSGAAGTTSTTGGTNAGQPAPGTGASGTAPASGPTEANSPGFGGSYDTGATSPAAPSNVAPGGTGGAPLDTSSVTVQEPTTATGGAGAAGTPETGSATQPATGGAGTAGTGTAAPSGTTAPAQTPSDQTQQAPQGAQGQAQTPVQTTQAPQGVQGQAQTTDQTAQATQGAQGQAQTPQGAAAANEEVTRLRQRVADLEQEMEARDTRATERTQSVQTQVDTHEQRAYEAERARQQRLARIQSGGQWMLAADQALEQGEMNVDNALDIADEDFSVVRQSAAAFGQGNVVVQAERIRAQIAYARDAANRRDSYAARIALQSAGDDLRLARAASLERSGTSNSLLNP